MKIDGNVCISCGACIATCPVEAISFNAEGKAEVNQDVCVNCGACASACPVNAMND